jgi:hypothetical protein
MNRSAKIFAACHLYPIFMVLHMQFLNWDKIPALLFIVIPTFFVCILVHIWIKTSHIRLCASERRSLYLFIYFFLILHIYYSVCTVLGGTKTGDLWILKHNLFFFYFAIFISIFYTLYYCVNRQRDK